MKKILPILLAVLSFAISARAAVGETFTVDGLIYKILDETSNTVAVTGLSNSGATAITIPVSVSNRGVNYDVTEIGESAFMDAQFELVTFEANSNVTEIAAYAFRGSKISEITIPKSVESIGDYAFGSCNLGSITFEDGSQLKSIGNRAFNHCENITAIIIPASVENIGDSAFYFCENLQFITFENNSKLKRIGASVLGMTGITKITIPGSVTEVDKLAFGYCSNLNFVEFEVNSNLKLLNERVFYASNSIKTVIFTGENAPTIEGSIWQGFCNPTIFVPSESISAYQEALSSQSGVLKPYANVDNLLYCKIDESENAVKVFGIANKSATSIIIPAQINMMESGENNTYDVAEIGEGVFNECRSLTLVIFSGPEVPNIGNGALPENQQLDVYVPAESYDAYKAVAELSSHDLYPYGVETDSGIRYGDLNYSKIVEVDNSVMVIGLANDEATSISIPDNILVYDPTECSFNEYVVTAIGDDAFSGNANLAGTLTIGEKVKTIGNNAFNGCANLSGDLKIPDSVTSIGESAFEDCKGFVGDIIIPNSVTYLGTRAFIGCEGFNGSIIIGDNLTEIRGQTFQWCYGLTGTITIGKNVTSIGVQAFQSCAGLTGDLKIPDSVTTIGFFAFYGCSGLDGNLTIGKNVISIDINAFEECQGLKGDLIIPNSVTSIGNNVFHNCQGFNGMLTIGENVETIGDNSFAGCSGLTGAIIIPNLVTSIGKSAFAECSNIKYILSLCKDNIPTLGESAFPNIEGNIYVPIEVEESYKTANVWSEYAENIIGVGTVNDDPIRFGDLNYQIISSEVKEVEVTGLANDDAVSISIPEKIYVCDSELSSVNEYAVTSIGASAFSFCSNLELITIPNSVKEIGQLAFGHSGLTYIEIPESITSISTQMLESCTSLTEAVIPKSVTSIGANAFDGCNSLTSINLPESVTEINHYAFKGCSNLESIDIPNSVTWIGSGAFQDCASLKEVVIPNSVTRIFPSAFSNCSALQSVAILDGEGVLLFDSNVFSGVQLNTLNIGRNIDYDSEFPFAYQTSLKNLTFSNTVTSFDWDPFRCCTDLESIVLPNCLTKIEDNMFKDFNKLISVEMPESLTEIGSSSFYGCEKLESIKIPETVTSIGDLAFCGCYGLKSIELPESVVSIGDAAFLNCSYITSISLSSNINYIGASAFGHCLSLTSITLPESITSINSETFIGCESLEALEIPKYVNAIEFSAFEGCSRLKSLELPESVVSIGEFAFYNCSGMTGDLVIPSSVTYIGANAFNGCTGLNGKLIIGEKVESIGSFAFSDCSSIDATLCLGTKTVPTIAEDSFTGVSRSIYVPAISENEYLRSGWLCFESQMKPYGIADSEGEFAIRDLSYRLIAVEENVEVSGLAEEEATSITIPEKVYVYDSESISVKDYSVTSIGDNAFMNYNSLNGVLEIPNSVTSIGNSAFENCVGLSGNLSIPNSVTYLGEKAFKNCKGFSGSLTISDNIEKIEDQTFQDCSGFTGVLCIGENVTSIGDDAFAYCNFTGDIIIPTSVKSIGNNSFKECHGFNGFLIIGKSSIETIGESAFYGCSGINGDLIIPNSVTSIGEAAFFGCEGFDGTLTLGENVETIGDFAFADCSQLKGDLIISDKIVSIGPDAFNGSNNINDIYYLSEEPKKLENPETLNVNEDVKLHVSPGVKKQIINGQITPWCNFTNIVINGIFGDCDYDGIVSIDDAIKVANYAVGNEIAGSFYDDLADVNGDEKVTISDAVGTVEIVLTQPIANSSEKISAFEDEESDFSDSIILGELCAEESNNVTLEVGLNNSLGYVALQADVYVPEGMSFESVAKGLRSEKHTVMHREVAENVYRVVVFNFEGFEFAECGGSLFTLHFTTDGRNDGMVSMSNVIASDAKGSKYILGVDQAHTTGIGNVSGSHASITREGGDIIISGAEGLHMAIYTTDGKLIENGIVNEGAQRITLGAGIYIVAIGDASKKIVIK